MPDAATDRFVHMLVDRGLASAEQAADLQGENVAALAAFAVSVNLITREIADALLAELAAGEALAPPPAPETAPPPPAPDEAAAAAAAAAAAP
ncbi:MAG: hypothetical protein HY719_01245, partial [Planctomycetes bacterium]|nr:hypothetical protein [Planctomycetota bacterium]